MYSSSNTHTNSGLHANNDPHANSTCYDGNRHSEPSYPSTKEEWDAHKESKYVENESGQHEDSHRLDAIFDCEKEHTTRYNNFL